MAKEGAALDEPGRSRSRPGGVDSFSGAMVLRIEPVRTPLPGIAGYRVQAITVGRKGVDGTGAGISVVAGVVPWKFSLPDVAEMFAFGAQFISPGIELLHEAAAGREFPFASVGSRRPDHAA